MRIAFLCLLFLLPLIIFYQTRSEGESEATHTASYPLKDFYVDIEQEGYVDRLPETIYGGIVSHHLLAADDIAKFFAEFRSQEISTIVLIGPNHFAVGEKSVLVSEQPYSTPWGRLSPDTALITELSARGVVTIDERPFVEEHSISALVSYIAYNFPNAKLVPIVLKRETSRPKLDDLAGALQMLLPENAVIIASVDFSHHLNSVAAQFHDIASVSAIQQFDYSRVFNLEIDSPPSIYTLLKYLDSKGAKSLSYKNLDSTSYTGNSASEDVTSYVFGHFTKGESVTSTIATSLHFGDMMFAREVHDLLQKGGDPFEKIQGVEGNFLRGVDITMANLEGVLTDTESCRTDKEVIMRFEQSYVVPLLAKYGLDGVTLTNNHSLDCFTEGFDDTVSALAKKNIFAIGSKEMVMHSVSKQVGTEKIAFVGINEIELGKQDFEAVYAEIRELRKAHDSIVVHVHWGYEYDSKPSKTQIALAHGLVDAGANVIIGHHPHVIQTVERYNDGLIFYSVGNFIFDQPTLNTRTGFGVGLVHGTEKIGGYIFPYRIESLQPGLLPYEEMKEFCSNVLDTIEKDMPCSF